MQIRNLRYNANEGLFKASVDIERGGQKFRYPCEVPGPQTMEPAMVIAGLRRRAMKMSDTPR